MTQPGNNPFPVPCGQCRFWHRDFQEAAQGSCQLAAGNMRPSDNSHPKMSVENEYWDRESSLTGGGAVSSALYTDRDFSCIHAEAGRYDGPEDT